MPYTDVLSSGEVPGTSEVGRMSLKWKTGAQWGWSEQDRLWYILPCTCELLRASNTGSEGGCNCPVPALPP